MGKELAVIGDPIKHSLSRIMHQKWLEELKLDAEYKAIMVSKSDLSSFVEKARCEGMLGFNVTIPHKVAIMSLLDEVDDSARRVGAVNTVICKNDQYIGANTDGLGFVQSLKENGIPLGPEMKILIVGAGGAARAIGLTLAYDEQIRVDFTNRTLNKAQELSLQAAQYVQSQALPISASSHQLGEYDMVINATSVGLDSYGTEVPIDLSNINSSCLCIDIIYKPIETFWLKQAKDKGCRTLNGIPMLVHQGALAFYNWFGVMPDTTDMVHHLSHLLEHKLYKGGHTSC